MKHANISLFVTHAGCPHQCSFCNQKTISGALKPLSADEVTKTLLEASNAAVSPESTEIAFFGGSFTAIERSYMLSLLEAAYPFVKNGRFSGIRVSTRPDAIDSETLDILKSYGVTAIELGAQSTDDEVLLLNERGHTRADIIEGSRLIKQSGISLGLQMMTGLYGDTDEKCVQTARDIIALAPDTVRVYPTVTLENTRLAEFLRSGEYKPQTLEKAVRLCSRLLKMFHDNNINVIRLGLHSGGNVEEGYLAGPYHPAFRELCESEIYLDEAKTLLKNSKISKKSVTFYVNDREISKMTGQKRSNIDAIFALGYTVAVKGDASLKKYEIRLGETYVS